MDMLIDMDDPRQFSNETRQAAEEDRLHLGIENQLHWLHDVTVKEDASTVRLDNAPDFARCLNRSSSTSCAWIRPSGSNPAFA